jgi:hypothetical protein
MQLDPVDRSHAETAELAARFLNCTLDGVNLCPEMRKSPATCSPKGFSSQQVEATDLNTNQKTSLKWNVPESTSFWNSTIIDPTLWPFAPGHSARIKAFHSRNWVVFWRIWPMPTTNSDCGYSVNRKRGYSREADDAP